MMIANLDQDEQICSGNGGLVKRERMNLGLSLLQIVAIPGQPLVVEDIAAWCGCTRGCIQRIEQRALRKIRNALMFRNPKLWAELREILFDRDRATTPATRRARL